MTLLEQTTQSVQLDVRTPQPAMLVLADTNYPGWAATVDAAATPILPADYVFRAVEVPAGEHTVEFVFSPPTLKIGATISLLALLVSAALLALELVRARARH